MPMPKLVESTLELMSELDAAGNKLVVAEFYARWWEPSSGKKNKQAVVVLLMSACTSLWISCTTINKWQNLFFFPLLAGRGKVQGGLVGRVKVAGGGIRGLRRERFGVDGSHRKSGPLRCATCGLSLWNKKHLAFSKYNRFWNCLLKINDQKFRTGAELYVTMVVWHKILVTSIREFCQFAMPYPPKFHLPKQNLAGREKNQVKVKPPWSPCTYPVFQSAAGAFLTAFARLGGR